MESHLFTDWPLHGRTHNEQRFSSLTQINDQNISELGLAWYHDFETKRGLEATPIVINGVMYVSGSWSKVYAFDAVSGELLWQFDPEVPGEWAINVCCDVVNRGVAVWDGKVYVGTLDGRLIALNADTGVPLWDVLTIDKTKRYSITGAPRIAKGKVFIGNGGAEFGVRGYISAYEADSGELAWRFYTVPGDPSEPFENPILAKAAQTWTGEWWKLGGGGTVWDSMAYDPALDLLYFGTGNGSPWNQQLRSPKGGDNLFLSSIVAVRPDTGEYVWHYQTTPGESWDYTATQHIILADLEIKGIERKVLMQVPKNGFFYVIDRVTGELISAEPVVPVNWASKIDLSTGRPLETPQARYYLKHEPSLISPGFLGAHNWHPMSYSPDTGLVYVPTQEMSFPYFADKNFSIKKLGANIGVNTDVASLPDDPEIKREILSMVKGHITAWDPLSQKQVWRVEHAGPWNGGLLSTAGNLVFQGNAAGFFLAFSADSGKKLWSSPAGTGVVAPPVSYEINGEQYISVMAGWGGIFPLITGEIASKSGRQINVSRLLTYKLDGNLSLPKTVPATLSLQVPVETHFAEEDIDRGKTLYNSYCGNCHGADVVGGGVLPDLRYSGLVGTEAWFAVLLEGILKDKGMVSFKKELSKKDTVDIRTYIQHRAAVEFNSLNE